MPWWPFPQKEHNLLHILPAGFAELVAKSRFRPVPVRLGDRASNVLHQQRKDGERLHLVREIESSAGNALALKVDSAYPEELQSAVIKATEFFGPLDIFVSNAGILRRGTIDTYSLEDFDRMVAVNIRAAFIGIQAVRFELGESGYRLLGER